MAEMTLKQVRSNMRDAMNSVLKDDTRRMVVDWYNAIDAAIKQRDRDKLDVARYRWLAEVCGDADLFMETRNKSELDARIDAAMAKESGNG